MKPTILTFQSHHRKENSLYGTLAHLFPNCSILEVKNARDAVDAALAHPPDVLLMDMSHLRGKGGKVIHQLKRVLPDLSVIIVVKEENEIYRTDSATVSADAYISEHEVVHFLERLTSLVSQNA
jgi:DNA-binding NarL/FixJ family response regulator